MADVIVLSSDDDDDAVSLPIQEVERDSSFLGKLENSDYAARNKFESLSPEPEEVSSSSLGMNGTGKQHGTIKRARPIHDLSDSDDDDDGITFNNQKRTIHSSDDELPDININLSPVECLPKRIESTGNASKANGSSHKSPESKTGKNQKREEQRARKQLELAEKARQRQAKQEEREQKKKEAAQAKALKQAAAEIERSKKPGECLKWVTAILDPGLLKADYSGELLTALRSSEVDYKVEDFVIPCSVAWERRLQNVHVDDAMKVHKTMSIQNEPFVLIVWMWSTLISHIHENTLLSTVEEMISLLPDKELTVAVFGLEDYFRFQKTQKRRDVRSEVLGTGPQKRKAKEGSLEAAPMVSRGDVEHALAEIQVTSNVSHRIINSKTDLANLVCQFTKAIAEAPFKRQKHQKDAEHLDWYALGDSKDCVSVDKDGNGSLQLWQRQLCQFPLASRETSEAIISVYPSPVSLLAAFEKCSNEEEAQYLLEDIPVRRGPGPLSTTRRIGPQLSRKIHTFFTTFDEDTLIAPD